MTDHPREAEIKARVLEALRSKGRLPCDATIASEYPLGRSGVRCDLAILTDRFTGIEIKSDADSLRRLSRQLDSYRSYFDHVIVVLSSRHYLTVDPAVVSGCEVWELNRFGRIKGARRSFGRLTESRCARRALTDLMTAKERISFERGAMLAGAQGAPTCEECFSRSFRLRFGATSAALQRAASLRPIVAADVELLSRFRSRRDMGIYVRERSAARLAQWAEANVNSAEIG